MCFAPDPSTIRVGSKRFPPKHDSNPDAVIQNFTPHSIDLFACEATEAAAGRDVLLMFHLFILLFYLLGA